MYVCAIPLCQCAVGFLKDFFVTCFSFLIVHLSLCVHNVECAFEQKFLGYLYLCDYERDDQYPWRTLHPMPNSNFGGLSIQRNTKKRVEMSRKPLSVRNSENPRRPGNPLKKKKIRSNFPILDRPTIVSQLNLILKDVISSYGPAKLTEDDLKSPTVSCFDSSTQLMNLVVCISAWEGPNDLFPTTSILPWCFHWYIDSGKRPSL